MGSIVSRISMALSRMITANSPTDLSMLTKFLRYRVRARVVTICQPSDESLTDVPSGVIFASDRQAAVTWCTLDLGTVGSYGVF
jgi:hypothetical protein